MPDHPDQLASRSDRLENEQPSTIEPASGDAHVAGELNGLRPEDLEPMTNRYVGRHRG